MVPALCYRREPHWRERFALAVGMWPPGEVGAGVLIVSLSYGLSGPMITTEMLSLALNLVLTGVFILLVKQLIASVPRPKTPPSYHLTEPSEVYSVTDLARPFVSRFKPSPR
jgi:hypothetical protein